EAQNQGLGSQLLSFAFKRSDLLRLWTFQVNEKAISFYKKHGFIEVKRTDGRDNEENEPDVLMQWVGGTS
ncbi:MAG: GNAT family N-acetyltransferase, partial [Pseudomonadota bacterium]